MQYATVSSKKKIDYLIDKGFMPLCGIGEAAVFEVDGRYRDMIERLEIRYWFGNPYGDFIPLGKYENIYKLKGK